MSIQGSIRENATAAAGKYEPVSVEARYENPRCDIASDPSLNWLKRLSPVLLVNKWAFGSGFALTIVAMLASVSIPALTGKLIDAIGPAVVSGQIESFKLFLWILCGLSVVRFAASFGGNYQLGRVSTPLEAD